MGSGTWPIVRDRRFVVAFFILVVAGLLVGNASTPLWDQDEAAYAGFAKNMLERHDWLVPSFPYGQVHRKVPLTFWMIAGSYAVFGVNEFALRLPSALAIAGTIACVWYGARFFAGADGARLGAMILASMPFVLTLGKIALTDGVLLLFETIAALALLRGAVRPTWKATAVLWVAVAAGVMTKGPPIILLIGGMFLFLLVFHRRRRNLVHLHPWFGLPLALVPTVVWGYAAWQQDPGYVLFFGYWYILRRVGSAVWGQSGPPGTFLLMFFVALAPWTGYLLTALGDAWKGVRRRRMAGVLLASWLFGGWLIWELPLSKLPTYALGAFPALALLLAWQVRLNLAGRTTWATHASLRAGFRILVGVCVVLAGVVLVLGLWRGPTWVKPVAIVPAAVVAGVGVLAYRLQRGGAALPAVRTLLMGGLIANLLIWVTVVSGVTRRWAVAPQIAEAVAAKAVPDTLVVCVRRMSMPSLPFYVQQAGFRFRDALDEGARPALEVDGGLVWRLKFRELRQQVEAQMPEKPSLEEERVLRVQRAGELWRSGQALALVLDEEQYGALAGDLSGAQVFRVEGWQLDRLARTTYVVALTPAAVKVSAADQRRP